MFLKKQIHSIKTFIGPKPDQLLPGATIKR